MTINYASAKAPDYQNEYLPEIRKIFRESYHYFDFPAMLEEIQISDTTWRKAWNLQRNAVLHKPELWYPTFFHSQLRCDCNVDFPHLKSTYNAYVTASFAQDCIRDMHCFVPRCSDRYYYFAYDRHVCAHQVAALILMGQYFIEQNPGDATSLETFRLLNEMDSVPQTEMTERNLPPLQMEMQVKMKNGELTCSFRVGEDRLYKVKNLQEFVEAVEGGREMSFGSKTTIRLDRSRFQGRAEEYYEFLQNWIYQQRTIDRYRERKAPMSYRATGFGDSLVLSGDDLDRIFMLADEGDEILFQGEDRKKHVLAAKEVELRPKLALDPERDSLGRLTAVHLTGALPDLMYGQKGAYYIEDGTLCRVDPDAYRNLRPLLRTAEYGDLDLVFGRKEFGRMKYDFLPILEKNCEIIDNANIDDEFEDIVPPELEFTFYLDAADQDVTCTAAVHIAELPEYTIRNKSVVLGKPDGKTQEALQEKRNRHQLERVVKLLKELFPVCSENGQYRCGGEESVIYDFLSDGLQQLMMYGEVQSTDAFRRIHIVRKPVVSVGTRLESDLLNLSISAEGIPEEELAAVLQSYRLRKKYHRLRNGDFVHLESGSLQSLDEMAAALDISDRELAEKSIEVPMYRALYIDRMSAERDDLNISRDRNFKSLIREFRTVEEADYDPPVTLQGRLRPYQETGYRWLRMMYHYNFSGILADDMGLGKTIEVISVLLAWKEEGLFRKTLIVAPASLIFNWKAEIERFAPSLSTRIIAGTKSERRAMLCNPGDEDVTLTSYDLMKRDVVLYEDLHFDYQILDEAQYIKNAGTAAAKSIKLVHSTNRLALTGTPIENRLSELWSIFDFLMPGFLYSKEEFRRSFEKPIMKHGDEEAGAQLRRMIAPFVVRRLKGDVLRDLPDKLEEVYYSEMGKEQRRLYDAQVASLRQKLHAQKKEDFNKNRIQVLSDLMRIREICCEPSLVYENYGGESAKRETFIELVENAIEGGHRLLVFSQFTSMLAVLGQSLAARGIEFFEITGSTPKQKRLELVNRFNSGDTPVFLISLKAGGFGLNLTGADMVIHYDPWWNVAARNQATDRAHRIGQTKVVTVYDMIIKDSIEEKIRKLQEAKQKLADEVLSGEQVADATLNRDEILEILG